MTNAAPPVHSLRRPRHHRRRTAARLLKLGPAAHWQQEKSALPPVRRICISDTHNLCPTLPDGEILIHAGDLSEWGSFDEVQAQITWLSKHQPHKHKIIIAGNHDLLFDLDFLKAHPKYQDSHGRTENDLDFGSVTYLQDESIAIPFPERNTTLHVFGSPWTPQYGTSAFQYPREKDIWRGKIPLSTDILVTHGPPARFPKVRPSAGCEYLREEVARIKPKLMVFGHIHVARGEQKSHLTTHNRCTTMLWMAPATGRLYHFWCLPYAGPG